MRRFLPRRGTTVRALLGLAAIGSTACVEPHAAVPRATELSSREIGLQVVVSDTLAAPGTAVAALVRLRTATGAPGVQSYTGRLTYDTLALAFVGERSSGDEGTRALNPQPGVVRSAGIATGGFPRARLFAVTFTVRRAGGARTLTARLDELHAAGREDLLPRVRPLPIAQERLP